jgi:peptidoglycan/LPS O-acetylase OafA/YrhL
VATATALSTPECLGPLSAPKLLKPNPTSGSHIAQTSTRIPALDGLRGIAILLVLLRHSVAGTETSSHFWYPVLVALRLSWSGVDLFFVLSGFLIGGILLDARASSNYFRTFYIRRAFRILPVYGVFLALYLGRHAAAHVITSQLGRTSPLPIPWFSFLTFTQNFWMVAFGWFGPMALAPTWSLAVEEQFYLTVPLLIRRMRARTLFIVLVCIVLLAPVVRAILPHLIAHGDFATYVLMPCRADALGMGVLAALALRNAKLKEQIKNSAWLLYSVAALTFAGVVFLTIRSTNQYQPPISSWGLSCLALFYTSILVIAISRAGGILERFLSIGLLRGLGTIAYCTYLIHEILIETLRKLLQGYASFSNAAVWSIGGALGVGITLVIASVSWRVFERPLVRRGHKYQY